MKMKSRTFPRSAVQRSVLSSWFWYRLCEGSGATLTDLSGNGPALTVAGTTTNIWTANAGWLTPAGDNYARAVNAYWARFFDTSAISGKQVLINFQCYFDGTLTANETFLSYGAFTSGAGGHAFGINNSAQLQYQYNPIGAGTSTQVFPSSNMNTDVDAGPNKLLTLTFDFRMTGLNARCDAYWCAAGMKSGFTDLALAGATTSLPGYGIAASQPFTLMAYKNSTASDTYQANRMLGVNGSSMRLRNVLCMVRDTASDLLPAQLNGELHTNSHDFPRCLRGA